MPGGGTPPQKPSGGAPGGPAAGESLAGHCTLVGSGAGERQDLTEREEVLRGRRTGGALGGEEGISAAAGHVDASG